jgi:hypothetical protein
VFTASPATIPSPTAPSVTATSPVTTPHRAASPGTPFSAPRSVTAPTRSSAARTARCTADLLILDGNISDDPSLAWSPGTQRTIVQDGRVIANSRPPR